MPEFDTYRGIERYAKHPNSLEARQGFIWLLRRAETHALWNAGTSFDVDKLSTAAAAYVGCYGAQGTQKKPGLSIDDITQMPKDERSKWYTELCKSIGVNIDPNALTEGTTKKA